MPDVWVTAMSITAGIWGAGIVRVASPRGMVNQCENKHRDSRGSGPAPPCLQARPGPLSLQTQAIWHTFFGDDGASEFWFRKSYRKLLLLLPPEGRLTWEEDGFAK